MSAIDNNDIPYSSVSVLFSPDQYNNIGWYTSRPVQLVKLVDVYCAYLIVWKFPY